MLHVRATLIIAWSAVFQFNHSDALVSGEMCNPSSVAVQRSTAMVHSEKRENVIFLTVPCDENLVGKKQETSQCMQRRSIRDIHVVRPPHVTRLTLFACHCSSRALH